MKNIFSIALITIVVILIIFIGWLVLNKSGEGELCGYTGDCKSGLTCINSRCSSGKSGSFCYKISDCQTIFCTNNICSNGKDGEPCNTYADCDQNYLCEGLMCIVKPPEPVWPKYFSKIELQKLKAGLAPGPDNVPVAASDFKTSDGINLNIQTKSGVSGEAYFEMINPVTGQVIFSYPKFEASGLLGRGFPAPKTPGNYRLRVYFKNELVDTIDFKVNE